MAPRDESLLIVDLTATYIRTGVGVHDLIRRPLVEMSTRCGRRPSSSPPKLSDYLTGYGLSAALAAKEELELVDPIIIGSTGFEVVDWIALEAVLRYCFHTAMGLPRPPLAHPVCLCLPPHLPPITTDRIHSLLFERLLVPQLLVASRPFFAAAGAGVTSGVVLDIGARGEGSEVSVVYESQVVESATLRMDVDEGDLDDWLALVLLEENPDLPELLKPTEEGPALSAAELYDALSQLVQAVKAVEGAIGFESPLVSPTTARVSMITDDDGGFDVAKALVEGGVDKIVKKAKPSGTGDDDAKSIEVSHPLNPSASPIKVGQARHRWLEPLFLPALLAKLAPSASAAAAQLGLDEFVGRAVVHNGVHEVIGAVVGQVEDVDQRRAAWESVVVVSTGKVASNKQLGPTLVPLLGPFVADSDSGSEVQPRQVKYAKMPDYFSEFKDKGGELGCYLGSCILAKILISDLQSKMFVSKQEYATKGPAHYRLLEML